MFNVDIKINAKYWLKGNPNGSSFPVTPLTFFKDHENILPNTTGDVALKRRCTLILHVIIDKINEPV